MNFKKLAFAAVLSLAASASFAAGTLTFDDNDNASLSYTPAATFVDTYDFVLPYDYNLTAGSLSSTQNGIKDIDFSAVYLTAGTQKYKFVQTSFDGSDSGEQWSLAGVPLVGGQIYTLHVEGTNSGSALYVAELSVVQAVPEPETYAMMLAGLGLVGFVARRRKSA